jgi:hypothetical protein
MASFVVEMDQIRQVEFGVGSREYNEDLIYPFFGPFHHPLNTSWHGHVAIYD